LDSKEDKLVSLRKVPLKSLGLPPFPIFLARELDGRGQWADYLLYRLQCWVSGGREEVLPISGHDTRSVLLPGLCSNNMSLSMMKKFMCPFEPECGPRYLLVASSSSETLEVKGEKFTTADLCHYHIVFPPEAR